MTKQVLNIVATVAFSVAIVFTMIKSVAQGNWLSLAVCLLAVAVSSVSPVVNMQFKGETTIHDNRRGE